MVSSTDDEHEITKRLRSGCPNLHGIDARFERWMYRRGRPNRLARLLNRGWAIAHAAGSGRAVS
jgi:hypothetical protein